MPPTSRSDELLSLAKVLFDPLREAELKLLRAAPQGEVAYCGPSQRDSDPANDPRKSDSWSPQRSIRSALIRWLCVDHQASQLIDPRGIQAHSARIDGPLDLSFLAVPFPLALNSCSLKEHAELRFLEIPTLSFSGSCVHSLNAECASVKGSVSLNNGFSADSEIQFLGAQIGSNLDCVAGTFRNPTGKSLRADRIVVRGSIFLRNAFLAEGEVRLLGAQIAGNLECNDGTFKALVGAALSADRIVIQGSVFLRDGFSAEGEVRMLGAHIGGNLECNAGKFCNPAGLALNADRIAVSGNLLLHKGFSAEGEVNLVGAQIGNNLACDGGIFRNPSGTALNADGIHVHGFVFLRNGFSSEGEVNLLNAEIGDNLECDAATFKNPSGIALNADRISIQGNLHFRNGFSAEGQVHLANALIKGTLVWTGVRNPLSAALNLRSASAGSIHDDQASWPAPGKLDLDGFVYGHITERLSDAKNRLAWLALQQPFTPQPYRQLAKVMRDAGVDRGELLVLFTLEDHLWKEEDSFTTRLLRWPLSLVVGYGYYPMRALLGLVLMVLIGWGVYTGASAAGAMVPKDQKAYDFFKLNGYSPGHYEPLSPFVFSLENSLPLVKLGQTDFWQPDPTPNWHPVSASSSTTATTPGSSTAASSPSAALSASANTNASSHANSTPVGSVSSAASPAHSGPFDSPRFLYAFLRLQILLGWILATLFIAGVTGIVQKD